MDQGNSRIYYISITHNGTSISTKQIESVFIERNSPFPLFFFLLEGVFGMFWKLDGPKTKSGRGREREEALLARFRRAIIMRKVAIFSSYLSSFRLDLPVFSLFIFPFRLFASVLSLLIPVAVFFFNVIEEGSKTFETEWIRRREIINGDFKFKLARARCVSLNVTDAKWNYINQTSLSSPGVSRVAARKFPPFPRAWNAIIIYLRGNLGLKVNGGGPEKHMAGLEKQRELLAIWQTISRRLLSYEWLCQCICHAPGINPY